LIEIWEIANPGFAADQPMVFDIDVVVFEGQLFASLSTNILDLPCPYPSQIPRLISRVIVEHD
jgi:hypothetical protein